MNAVYKLNKDTNRNDGNQCAKVISCTYKNTHNNKDRDQKPYVAVQPIKSLEDIKRAKSYFLTRPERYKNQNIRDWCIFVLGINTARRAGDLLRLKIEDVLDEKNNIKSHITIREQKTNKTAQLIITPTIREALELYLPVLENNKIFTPLFPSRNIDKNLYVCSKCGKGSNKLTYYCEKRTYQKGEIAKVCEGILIPNKRYGNKKPMTVVNFYMKLQKLKEELELNQPIGTHSMRKSWAYHAVKNNAGDAYAVAKVSNALNHSDVKITSRYLGFDQEEIDETLMNNQL